jgi:hypothetical protein
MTVQQVGGAGQPTPDLAELDWRNLTSDALEISGGDLERGDSLVGVPFCITGLKFWRGDYQRSDIEGKNGDVVAVYIVVAPQSEILRGIRRNRIAVPLSVEPGEVLVFNEAGTGMYRQLVSILEAQGMITLPEGPGEGTYGESRFDTPIDEWEYANLPAISYADYGDSKRPTADFQIKILCPRGLRVSDYENEHTKQGRTRYIG